MICISWGPPSGKKQQDCLAKTRSGAFNYDQTLVGRTQMEPFGQNQRDEMQKNGYAVNHVRVHVGTGESTYLKAKECLKNWSHFQLGWATVDPRTPIKAQQQFCVRVKELFTWVLTPLEIIYVHDTHEPKPLSQSLKGIAVREEQKIKRCYTFGSGTLEGHLLAGEEMFAIKWHEDDTVWYEILSFSKPATLLSKATYPYVQWRQKLFAKESSKAMVREVSKRL